MAQAGTENSAGRSSKDTYAGGLMILIGVAAMSQALDYGIGSLNASIVHPREVFRPAILASAASIIVAHNHPSGDPEPSEEDLSITRRLAEVGELLGIGLLDHVVIARRGVTSLRARGAI